MCQEDFHRIVKDCYPYRICGFYFLFVLCDLTSKKKKRRKIIITVGSIVLILVIAAIIAVTILQKKVREFRTVRLALQQMLKELI